MPEWVVERGIGETRYGLLSEGKIVEARILIDGIVPAGSILQGRLRRANGQHFVEAGGEQFLLPGGAPGTTDGALIRIEVTREHIPGVEAWKRPLARVLGEGSNASLPSETDQAASAEPEVLDRAGWSDLIDEARTGVVGFEGGELHLFATPAMTLIDVNGTLPSQELAVAAARAAATTIRRLQIGGSIGIDFPTLEGKAARTLTAAAIDQHLPLPFERTAVNGFGFLQIVRPRRHVSLLELTQDRASFEARALLRRAEREPPGRMRLVAHPAVVAEIGRHPDWIAALERRVGGAVSLRADHHLAMSGAYAEKA